jgi:hypothetical protein
MAHSQHMELSVHMARSTPCGTLSYNGSLSRQWNSHLYWLTTRGTLSFNGSLILYGTLTLGGSLLPYGTLRTGGSLTPLVWYSWLM